MRIVRIVQCNVNPFLCSSSRIMAVTMQMLHCLKETVNYFINHGSRVFCTFLDASKAFDRLVHSGLFIKLMDRNVPLVFLDIIISWYGGLTCQVKWGLNFSGSPAGRSTVTGFLLHLCWWANDKASENRKGMSLSQTFCCSFVLCWWHVCPLTLNQRSRVPSSSYCEEWDIGLNAQKSCNLYFWKRTVILHDILLNGRISGRISESCWRGEKHLTVP